uniref:hypothetical protein n=1 Tax=Alistipes sp. TaxID=1872444 RepID=UPI0040564288
MKRLLYIGLILGVLVACKDSGTDDHVKQEALVTASSLTVGQEGDEPPMWGVTIGGVDYTQYAFEQGDQIRVVSQKGVDVILTAEESGTTGVGFVGDIRPVAEVDTYYAVYPADVPISADGVIHVNLEQQDGTPKRAVTLAALCEDAVDAKIHFDFRPINALISVEIVGRPCTITRVSSYSYEMNALENSYIPTQYDYSIATGEVAYTAKRRDLTFVNEEGITGNHLFVAYAPDTHLSTCFYLNAYRMDKRWIGYSTAFSEEGMTLKEGYTYKVVIDNESEIIIDDLKYGTQWVEATLVAVKEEIRKLYYIVVPQDEESVSVDDVTKGGEEILLEEIGSRSAAIRIDNLTAATAYRLCVVGSEMGYTELYSSSFTTNPPMLQSEISLVDYERIECAIEADGLNEIRCLALPAEQTADIERVMQEGTEAEPLSEEGKYGCALMPLNTGTDYKVYVVGRYGGNYTEMQCHEARTLGEKTLFNVQHEKSGSGWIDCSFQIEGYDQIRCMITPYRNTPTKEEVFAEGVAPNGKGGGTGVSASHRFENLDDDVEYRIHAVAKHGELLSEVRTLVAKTNRPYLSLEIADIGTNWVECRFTSIGYEEVRYLIADEEHTYTLEQVAQMGQEPTLAEGSDEQVQYYTCREELDFGHTYTIYLTGRSGERATEMEQERIVIGTPKVYCGVRTSYSYYKHHQSDIANQLFNISFVLGEKLTLNGKVIDSGAHSTYHGIEDDEIARGYIQIFDGQNNLRQERSMLCRDGIIGYGQELNLDYYDWRWAAYTARAVVVLKSGLEIASEPIELHLTGLPYDTLEGEYHGFYDAGMDILPDGYRSLQYPWKDITNGIIELTSSFIFFRGHDHLHMEGGLRWPQVLSPEFHIPEGGIDFYAYMHITRAWNLRNIVLALDFSDDEGNDGSNVMEIKASSFDEIEAESEVRRFHPDYPCLQIEHQDAFKGPWSRVHRLILRYEE